MPRMSCTRTLVSPACKQAVSCVHIFELVGSGGSFAVAQSKGVRNPDASSRAFAQSDTARRFWPILTNTSMRPKKQMEAFGLRRIAAEKSERLDSLTPK